MDIEKRLTEMEIDVEIAEARADAALQLAFKLFDIIRNSGLNSGPIEHIAPQLFAQITENGDPAYEMALLDEWSTELTPKVTRPGDAYITDINKRIALRKRIADRIHADRTRTRE